MIAILMIVLVTNGQNETAKKPLAQLIACKDISDAGARLSCYDDAVKIVADAERKKDIVVMDRTQVQKAKRSLFGFSLPSIKLFGDGDADTQLKRVSGVLRSTQTLTGGLRRFTIDDGGTWETTEETMGPPRVGDTVTITAGPLGSYIATAPGRRSVRVRRLR